MATNVETEFKFRSPRPIEVALVDAAVRESSFTCSAASSRQHNDIYLDDAQRSLARSGIGLRLRVDGGKSVVTCKSRGRRDGAMFVREEHEAAWDSPTTPPTAAELPDPLRDVVEPIVLRRPLLPVLRLDVTRDLRRLDYDERELCELAVDHVQAHGAGRSVQFTEIEIEVVDDLPSCEKLAEHLEHLLEVQAASNDKPTHAAKLLGLANQNGTVAADAGAPSTTALAAVLRRQIGIVQLAETQVRQSRTAEPVHVMRTSLRRLRSVASAFRTLWPKGESCWIRAHLRALTAELGRVRDLDVMVARLPASVAKLPPGLQPGAERVLDWLRESCMRAHDDLAAWLRCPQRLDDAQRFLDLVFEFAPQGNAIEPTISAATRACLEKCTARVRRRTKALTEDSPIAHFHAARIAARQLRYLLEELPQHASAPSTKTPKRLGKLQLALGGLCDGDTAVARLLGWEWQIRRDCDDQPLVGAALGAMIQQQFSATRADRPAALESVRRERRRLRLPK